MVCNSGHFNVELDLDSAGQDRPRQRRQVREIVDEYVLTTAGASTSSARAA